MDVLPGAWVVNVGPVIGVVVALVYLAGEVRSTVNVWRGPMLLVRGAVADTELPMPAGGEDFAKAAAGVEHTAIVLLKPRIHVLSPEGCAG